MIERPEPGEYPAFYAPYVDNLPDTDVLALLWEQLAQTAAELGAVDAQRAAYRYAEGKWTATEVLVHVVDIERVFATRAMRFARGDATELPGVDQDDLMRSAGLDGRALSNVLAEYEHLRRANLALFESLTPEQLLRRGVASGGEVTVRALIHHIAGHERHHLGVLRERYLG